jgi:hypothetical protein
MTTLHSSIRKVSTNFIDRRRSLGRYSSLADSGNGICFVYKIIHTNINIYFHSALTIQCPQQVEARKQNNDPHRIHKTYFL